MFQDLDKTLAALLAQDLAVANVVVSFAAPDSDFPPAECRVSWLQRSYLGQYKTMHTR